MTAILVFVFGVAAGLVIAAAGAGFLAESAGLILTVLLAALAVVAVTGAVVLLFRRAILRRLTGVTETQLEALAEPLSRVAQAAIDGKPGAATDAARDFARVAMARYAWLSTRRWVVASITGLIAAMAALAGTALLFKQNELIATQTDLLNQQNAKIEAQTVLLSQDVQLAEASRNAALAVEMTEIAALIGGAAERAMEGAASASPGLDPAAAMVNVLDPFTELDRSLLLRIVSISQSVRPYRFVNTGIRPDDVRDNLRVAMERRRTDLPGTWARLAAAQGWAEETSGGLIDRPASPERGHLLRLLVGGGIRNLEVLNHFGLDLSFALYQDSTLALVTATGARLAYADFDGTHVRGSDFGGAFLENARFRRTVIAGTTFAPAEGDRIRPPYDPSDGPFPTFLAGADFADAYIRDSDFSGANLTAARFDGAALNGVDFRSASLGAATFRGTVVLAANFTGADLRSVDFDGAILFGDDPLGRLAAVSEPGRFVADRFRADPVALDEVMANPVIIAQVGDDEIAAVTGGAPAFRITRIAPFQD